MLTGIGDRLIQPADHQNLSLLLGQRTYNIGHIVQLPPLLHTCIMHTGSKRQTNPTADHQNLSLLLGHKYAIDQALSIGSIGESTSSMTFESVDLLFSSVMYVVRTQSRPT